MAYRGKVQERTIIEDTQQKRKISWVKVIIWYIGFLISFIPIFIDALVYLNDHRELDTPFFRYVCTKGDVLWILATLLILTVIEGCLNATVIENSFGKWFLIAGAVIWGICFAIWVVFKYIYPDGFDGDIVLWVNGIMVCVALIICSGLQMRYVEEKV